MNKEKNVDVTGIDMVNMMIDSLNIDLTISKRIGTQDVTISGGTGIGLVDMYVIIKALEEMGKRLLPMMKGPDGLREALHGIIEAMEFEDDEEEQEGENGHM